MQTVDVVVVGAGPTGENVAGRAVAGGLTALVVEAELVGGECSYWACMPSKALLRPVHALRAARRVAGTREAVTGELDVAAVLARRDSFVSQMDDSGQVAWLDGAGIGLLRGHGRLVGERRVDVTGPDGTVVEVEARVAVVLATGTTAAVPDVPGLRDARPWTSREATSSSRVPGRLVVLGAGVVGLEMAQAWRGLGSEVVVLDRGERLLPRQERFAGELVEQQLLEDGVDVRHGAAVARVERDGDGGPVTVHLEDGSTVTGDELLVAAGRRPATGDLGLEVVGLEPGASVPVDDSLRVTGVDWLYAAGDVDGRALLTHQGKYQARVCGDAVVARSRGEEPAYLAEADEAMVPQVMFTDPEVASVGLTGAQAAERGLRVRTVEHDLGAVAGASLHADGYRGRACMVVDEDRGVVVGATFVGQDVADLLHSATVAVVGEVPLRRLRHAVPSYPTMSEVWLRLLEDYGL
ncbi:dihydrolipoyl dehydrogenase family protein [Aquipuribacter hungaricus]|uniref:Dihydrolipoyl dehydrogenase family protein n=1 Tax=Aquipuribacter hungaricus TaxID=545624 RepID=A0ABV7WL79_9MICO